MTNAIATILATLDDLAQKRLSPLVASDELPPTVEKARRRTPQLSQREMPQPPPQHAYSVEELRDWAWREMSEYLASPLVTNRLLLRLPAGTGKTFLGVKLALLAQAQGLRVAYVVPRHDFFQNLLTTAAKQGATADHFYQWLPRTAQTATMPETCHLTEPITTWMQRGYRGATFCRLVCGFHFMQSGCAYHQQPQHIQWQRSMIGVHPIVVLQHQHIVTGHRMLADFDLLIGDESPIGVYSHFRTIPAAALLSDPTIALDSPFFSMLNRMRRIAEQLPDDGQTLSGDRLLNELGGAAAIVESIDATLFNLDVMPALFDAHDALQAGYAFAYDCAMLLKREATRRLNDEPTIERIYLDRRGLHMFMKHRTNHELPSKVIWLDATGDATLYERVVGWRICDLYRHARLDGGVFQVTESVFNKTAMIAQKRPTPKAMQLKRIIDHLIQKHQYENPLIVTYSELCPIFAPHQTTYFYGNRGSNTFEDCDAVFVVGSPQPPAQQIETMAKMLFFDRDEPFKSMWCSTLRAYPETDQQLPVSGLWLDPDLSLLLDQLREAEIVQSAHRIRPILRPKPIWLFTNIPIADLPPTHLYSLLDALQVGDADHLNATTFLDVLDIVDVALDQHGYCTAQMLCDMLACTRTTAYRYLAAIAQYDPRKYRPTEVRQIGGGRPYRAIAHPD